MKNIKKILYIGSMITLVVLGVFLAQPEKTPIVSAACDANSTPGNLFGYILASHIDGPIYVSTESWNADPLGFGNSQTNADFYVNYDRNSGLWSGQAWHEKAGWIEFDSGILDKEAFVADATSPSPAWEWGYWNGKILLDEVTYSTNAGGFSGLGYSYHKTGYPTVSGDDVNVGLGILDFSNVVYVDSPCAETVDLFLNDRPNLHRTTCPVSAPTIKWTSQNVHSCQTAEGFWNNPGNRNTLNTAGEPASDGLPADGITQKLFRIRCVGDTTGSEVYGIATMSCGTGNEVTDPNSLIVPIIKEA